MGSSKQTFGHDVLMRWIKVLDIGYGTVIYFFLAIVCAKTSDKIFGNFDEERESQKSFARVTLELIALLWLYALLIYVFRNIVPLIPFPLDGYKGFEHSRVKEISNPDLIFVLVFLTYSETLKNKIMSFYKRLN